ncbi:MAG TPA: hypothetical protein VLI69_04300 [Gammaproteobacteria bacterium]|nr:hypothetical protein [Gammaproteobacteria bacterium]
MVWHTIKITNPANAAAELADEVKKLNLTGSAVQFFIQVGDFEPPQRAMVEVVPGDGIYHYNSHGRAVTEVLKKAVESAFPRSSRFIDVSGEEQRKLNEPFLKGEGRPHIPSLIEIAPEEGFKKIAEDRAARKLIAKPTLPPVTPLRGHSLFSRIKAAVLPVHGAEKEHQENISNKRKL